MISQEQERRKRRELGDCCWLRSYLAEEVQRLGAFAAVEVVGCFQKVDGQRQDSRRLQFSNLQLEREDWRRNHALHQHFVEKEELVVVVVVVGSEKEL